jgi:hypothetical protein
MPRAPPIHHETIFREYRDALQDWIGNDLVISPGVEISGANRMPILPVSALPVSEAACPVGPRWRVRIDRALSLAAIAAVVWFYGWTVQSAGGLGPANAEDLYSLLVRGYRKGHLHLDMAPPAELVALKDPYDPAQNGPYRLPDASYYRGHYYLYFGVVPAVALMLPFAVLTGHDLSTGAAVLICCVAGFLAASWLWLSLRRRYFPASAPWTGALGVLVIGLSTHVLALARRPMVWELPIATGFALAMLALGAVHAAVHGRRPLMALGLAGLFLGLAMAARPPTLFGAALLLAPLWLLIRRESHPMRNAWRHGLAAAAGLIACGMVVLAHNYARFENPLEFGQNFQLTAARELSNRHFGLDYAWHNLKVYYLFPLRWSWEFPFVSAQTPGWSLSDYAGSEEMCGLGVTFPFLWLALAAPLASWQRPEAERRSLGAMLGAIAGLYLGVGLFLLTFFSTTERYLAEFAPALALLAVIGWLGLERWAQRTRWRFLITPLTAIAAVATVPMGVLVSFNYHGNTFSRDRPLAWLQLERASHDALARIGVWTGAFEGPRVLKIRFQPRPIGTVETIWQAQDARANERVVVEHLAERELRFGFARGNSLVRWGRPLKWELGHTHTVELQLPSLYGAPGAVSNGPQRLEEFRERTSVAVWFSGGRALGLIVEPLPTGAVPGGAVGSGFTGDVRRMSKRPFRVDEVPQAGEPGWPRGGTLHLEVMLPTPLAPEGEPLFAAGALYASDLVAVRDAGAGAVIFQFAHHGAPPLTTRPLRLDPRAEHRIEITLPSCASRIFSNAARGEVILRVNGEEVLRGGTAECSAFGAGSESIGRNPFGMGSTREFRGWIVEARWIGDK